MNSQTNPDLNTRLKTASAMISVFAILIAFAVFSEIGRLTFSAVVLFLLFIGSYEYAKLPETQSKFLILFRALFFSSPGFILFFSSSLCGCSPDLENIFIVSLVSIALAQSIGLYLIAIKARSESDSQELFLNFSRDLLGFLLISVGGTAALAISILSPQKALMLVVIVAVADSAAYFAGRAFGKTKIAPIVSPKKTLVGSLIGIMAAGLVGSVLLMSFGGSLTLTWSNSFLISLLLAISSQSGDFAKSIAKRHFAVKDFGNILPGHGGVLDRLDGIFGAAPLGFILLILICKP